MTERDRRFAQKTNVILRSFLPVLILNKDRASLVLRPHLHQLPKIVQACHNQQQTIRIARLAGDLNHHWAVRKIIQLDEIEKLPYQGFAESGGLVIVLPTLVD